MPDGGLPAESLCVQPMLYGWIQSRRNQQRLVLPVREYRGMQSLCAWVQGWQRPVQSVEAASLYSGVQRWKTSAQGNLMLASSCTGYYLPQTLAGFAASPLSPHPSFPMKGGIPLEADAT